MEYIVYCDESNSNGTKFSDFFGGCIVSGKDWHFVEDALEAKKKELNLFGELKWTKVTAQYLERYIEIVDLFFDFVGVGVGAGLTGGRPTGLASLGILISFSAIPGIGVPFSKSIPSI